MVMRRSLSLPKRVVASAACAQFVDVLGNPEDELADLTRDSRRRNPGRG